MGGIWDAVCWKRRKKGSPEYCASVRLHGGRPARDTSVEEADNWSKAGERFAPLNPAASFFQQAQVRVVPRCSRTVTTIVSLCYTPPAPIAIIERSHRFPISVLRSLPASCVTGGFVTLLSQTKLREITPRSGNVEPSPWFTRCRTLDQLTGRVWASMRHGTG